MARPPLPGSRQAGQVQAGRVEGGRAGQGRAEDGQCPGVDVQHPVRPVDHDQRERLVVPLHQLEGRPAPGWAARSPGRARRTRRGGPRPQHRVACRSGTSSAVARRTPISALGEDRPVSRTDAPARHVRDQRQVQLAEAAPGAPVPQQRREQPAPPAAAPAPGLLATGHRRPRKGTRHLPPHVVAPGRATGEGRSTARAGRVHPDPEEPDEHDDHRRGQRPVPGDRPATSTSGRAGRRPQRRSGPTSCWCTAGRPPGRPSGPCCRCLTRTCAARRRPRRAGDSRFDRTARLSVATTRWPSAGSSTPSAWTTSRWSGTTGAA